MVNIKRKNNNKTSGKRGLKEKKPLSKSFLFKSKTYFLTFKGISDSGEKINKKNLANFLLNQNKNDKTLRPEKYLICEETYDSGEPHFHAILIYPNRKQIARPDYFDYLGIHPNIQTMRNMKAALQYVYKEDPNPQTNMDVLQQRRVARARDSSSLYQLLEEQMKKDPFNFDVFKFCVAHNLSKQIYKASYSKAVHLIGKVQEVYCNKLLFQKPGFKFISRAHIQNILSPSELIIFDSWNGYQTIIDYLNQIPLKGNKRKMKTKNLLITGPPGTGKTSLFHNPNHGPNERPIQDFCAVYQMGMSTWFPQYRSGVYHMILWNEAKLTSYAYDTLLKLLEGSYVDLPIKGAVAPKRDNPLVVMTSNMTLKEMIAQKFNYSSSLQHMARQNLSVRVQNVIVPEGYTLFLLQKLISPEIIS